MRLTSPTSMTTGRSLSIPQSSIGKYVKYDGETGKYTNGTVYRVDDSYELFDPDNCGASTLETSSGTSLSSSISCNIGDLIVAAIVTRYDPLTLSDGWAVVSSSKSVKEFNPSSASAYNHRLSLAYKYAESTAESISVAQSSAGRIYVNMVSFRHAAGFDETSYQYALLNNQANSFVRPTGRIVLWSLTTDFWASSGYPVWSISNESRLIQLGSSTQSRLLSAIDTSDDTSVTFTAGHTNTADAMICGPLVINLYPGTLVEAGEDDIYWIYKPSQTVLPDENTLISKAVIARPADLAPENILIGRNIGGVDGGLSLPQLHAPTAVASLVAGSDGLQYFKVTLPSTNGDFAEKLRLKVSWTTYGDEIVLDKALDSGTTSVNVYAKDFVAQRGVSFLRPLFYISGTNFFDSEKVTNSLISSLALVKYDLLGITLSPEHTYAYLNDTLNIQLTTDDGYYLPKSVAVLDTDGNELNANVSYDYDTGKLAVKYTNMATIADDYSTFFTIQVQAVQTPWLRLPSAVITENENLFVKFGDTNTEKIAAFYNNEQIFVIEDDREGMLTYDVELDPGGSSSYGFALQSDGYYKETSYGYTYCVALCKVNFTMKSSGKIAIKYVNYGYSSTTYGIIGKVDCLLSTSYSTDHTTSYANVYTTFASSNSTTEKTIEMDVPEGEHFIYFKFRRYSTSSSSYYFKFKILTEPAEISPYRLTDHFNSYGKYPIELKALAEKFTESDALQLDYIYAPYIDISNGILTVTNTVPSEVTAFELYFDDVLIDTLEYDAATPLAITLSDYSGEICTQPNIYIKAIGEGVLENQSNIITAWVIPAGEYPIYGVSGMYSSTVALTRTDDAVNMGYTINSDGSINSDFDNAFPWNKTELVTDENGNEFISFPQMFFRVTADSSYNITTTAVSGAPHNDGDWYEVKPFLYGRYGGSVTNNVLESKRGATRKASLTRADFRTYAKANGNNYHLLDLYHKTVLNFLWWIEWATKNSATIMTGAISGSGTTGGTSSCSTGGTDILTTPSGYEPSRKQMRYHYIEDFVGNFFEFLDGIYCYSNGSSYYDYATATPGNYSDTNSNHTKLPYSNSSNNCITSFGWDNSRPFLCVPHLSTSDSSYSTYFCDYVYRYSNSPIPRVGAAFDSQTTYQGISYMYCGSASSVYTNVGARLIKSQFNK